MPLRNTSSIPKMKNDSMQEVWHLHGVCYNSMRKSTTVGNMQ